MLSDKAYKAVEHIGAKVNKLTRESKEKIWKRNILKNKPYYIQNNPYPKGIVTYLVGAGPSLEKNIDELKNVGGRGIIVCIDANLEYLLDKGIKPEYCVSLDSSNKIYTMIKRVIKQTKNITLATNTASNPLVIKRWLGPKFFFSSPHPRFNSKTEEFYSLSRYAVAQKDIKKGDELLFNKNYKLVFPGVMTEIGSGGNVTTTAHLFCYQILRAIKIVFVGLDLSWTSDSNFYCNRGHQANVKYRVCNEHVFSAPDCNNGVVKINLTMEAFKRWHETVAMSHPHTCINATEGGVLGIDLKTGRKEPFIEFMKLKDVIKEYTPKDETKNVCTQRRKK